MLFNVVLLEVFPQLLQTFLQAQQYASFPCIVVEEKNTT